MTFCCQTSEPLCFGLLIYTSNDSIQSQLLLKEGYCQLELLHFALHILSQKYQLFFSSVLGIELLQYVFIMKFTLVDETGALNAYLFDYVSKSR